MTDSVYKIFWLYSGESLNMHGLEAPVIVRTWITQRLTKKIPVAMQQWSTKLFFKCVQRRVLKNKMIPTIPAPDVYTPHVCTPGHFLQKKCDCKFEHCNELQTFIKQASLHSQLIWAGRFHLLVIFCGLWSQESRWAVWVELCDD